MRPIPSRLAWAFAGALGAAGVAVVVGSRLAVRGQLTLDLGRWRSIRPLGPITVRIRAPRDVVYQQIAGPYLGRTPASLRERLQVLERSDSMALALHRTPVGSQHAVTMETVVFESPGRIGFRLVRGPVPHVVEEFALVEVGDGTELRYTGELGTDFGPFGRAWGDRVAAVWEDTVRTSLEHIREGAEGRADARGRGDRDS